MEVSESDSPSSMLLIGFRLKAAAEIRGLTRTGKWNAEFAEDPLQVCRLGGGSPATRETFAGRGARRLSVTQWVHVVAWYTSGPFRGSFVCTIVMILEPSRLVWSPQSGLR